MTPRTDAPFVVACDFDGTITVQDVTNLIWDQHLRYDWRRVLLPLSAAGAITPLQMIARGYADIEESPESLLAELRPRVELRPGFIAFRDRCQARGWPLQVLSYGVRFYVSALLPEGVPVTAFEGTFQDGGWLISAPADLSATADGSDFKGPLVRALAARHPGHTTVYIGDGRFDFPAARQCDRIFAVQGSTLAHLCRDAGVACVQFTHFDQVLGALACGD